MSVFSQGNPTQLKSSLSKSLFVKKSLEFLIFLHAFISPSYHSLNPFTTKVNFSHLFISHWQDISLQRESTHFYLLLVCFISQNQCSYILLIVLVFIRVIEVTRKNNRNKFAQINVLENNNPIYCTDIFNKAKFGNLAVK